MFRRRATASPQGQASARRVGTRTTVRVRTLPPLPSGAVLLHTAATRPASAGTVIIAFGTKSRGAPWRPNCLTCTSCTGRRTRRPRPAAPALLVAWRGRLVRARVRARVRVRVRARVRARARVGVRDRGRSSGAHAYQVKLELKAAAPCGGGGAPWRSLTLPMRWHPALERL